MTTSSFSVPSMPPRPPGLWEALAWAWQRGDDGGGVSRAQLVARTAYATLLRSADLQAWMDLVNELAQRGLMKDVPGEFLRAVRPAVHRFTDLRGRVQQLIDHYDWLEVAFKPAAFERLSTGRPVTLVEMRAPRGFEFLGLQVRRNEAASTEGELLLTLALQRSAQIQHQAQPVEVAAIAFSRFRIDNKACLAIGGVRGQRGAAQRVSQTELAQGLQGWQPAVLLVQAMQELARAWDLPLLALDARAHRLRGPAYRLRQRHRDAAHRIAGSYQALWGHFGAVAGPVGWVQLPLPSDDKLEATALSPEKRERQVRRADFWLRTRKALQQQLGEVLLRPAGYAEEPSQLTQAFPEPPSRDEWEALFDEPEREASLPRNVLDTGPQSLPE
jgi:uncharacterized protein VirK/YbjX